MWITVWNHEFLQHNQFLGETGICFDLYDLEKPIEEQLYRLKLYDFSNIVLPDDPTTKIVEYHVTPKKPIPVITTAEKTGPATDVSHPDTEPTQLEEGALGGTAVVDDRIDEPLTTFDEAPIISPTDVPKIEEAETTTAEASTTGILDEEITLAPTSVPSIPKIEIEPAIAIEAPVIEVHEEIMLAQASPPPSVPEIEETSAPSAQTTDIPVIEIEPAKSVSEDLLLDNTGPEVEKTSSPPPPLPPPVSKDVMELMPPKKPPRMKAKAATKRKVLRAHPKPMHPPSSGSRFVVVSASTRPSRQPKKNTA